MTKSQANAIKKLVAEKGWSAVRVHNVLGPIWAKTLKEQQEFENKIGD